MPQIELADICKRFTVTERPEGRFAAVRSLVHRQRRTVHALEGISFAIERGELVGYIGPNGAGKSTTVKVMSGILTPEEGTCRILGRTPWRERIEHVAHIGVVFGQRSQLWWDVPVSDSFELLRDIYGIPQARYGERLRELTAALELAALLRVPVRQLSLGQRMRCEVAAALLHSPEILFLDEPTIGLDAVSKLALRDFLLRENREHGVTMILTTHDMDDVEALCNRVMTIGRGKLLFDGTLEALKGRYAPLHRVKATLERETEPVELPGTETQNMAGLRCSVLFDAARIPAHRVVAAMAEAYPLRDIVVEEQNIDEIIAAMYQEMAL